MYKVHCLNNISEKGLSLLTDEYELTDNIDEANVILVRSANMHEMEISPNLKAVARAGAGVNNIPLEKMADAGVPVFNTPGANANAVKELVIAGMLMSARDLVGGIDWVKENAGDENIAKSAEKAKKAFAGGEILGKTIGVIGLGAIGRLVVQSCEALGMNTIGYDPYCNKDAAEKISTKMRYVEDLADLLSNSDYITIHVPAVESTIGMIDEKAISQIKNGAVFLNFSRDTLVNDEAMANALAEGKLSKYVTDFSNPAVVKMNNTLIFPHLGASTAEAEENCAAMAVKEVMDYLADGTKVHCVNM